MATDRQTDSQGAKDLRRTVSPEQGVYVLGLLSSDQLDQELDICPSGEPSAREA